MYYNIFLIIHIEHAEFNNNFLGSSWNYWISCKIEELNMKQCRLMSSLF